MQATSPVTGGSAGPWRDELSELVRGLSGGFLFGIPLLYTMEVWWLGAHVEPWRLLILLLLSLSVNCMLSHFAGFHERGHAFHPLTEALEAMAVGVVAAAATLFALGEVRLDMPLYTLVATVALESVPFSLGVSIANGLLRGNKADPKAGGDDDEHTDEGGGDDQPSNGTMHATLRDAGATIAGALFIASSIAPTEEVPMLSAQRSPLWLIGLVVFSRLV